MQSGGLTKLRSIALISALSLPAWSGASSDAVAMGSFPHDAPEVVVQTKCPPLRSYDPEAVKKARGELRRLLDTDPSAVTPGMIADYKLLRDQCKAYHK